MRKSLGLGIAVLGYVLGGIAVLASSVLDVWLSIQLWPNLIAIFFTVPLILSIAGGIAMLISAGMVALGEWIYPDDPVEA
jgi:hypothetical protein